MKLAAAGSRRALLLAGAVAALAIAAVLVWTIAARARPAISVYPSPKTLAASPDTSVVFRDAGAGDLGDVTVTGSASGRHPGRLLDQADGDGATFVPDRPFAPGEQVTVDAGRRIAGVNDDRTSFVIAVRPRRARRRRSTTPRSRRQGGHARVPHAAGPAAAGRRGRDAAGRRRAAHRVRRAQARPDAVRGR